MASPATALRDRTKKLVWYRQYGVKECWLVDPGRERIEVHDLTRELPAKSFAASAAVRSAVLPRLRLRASRVFDA